MIDDESLIFLVADVSGKSIPASLFMMRAKTMIRNYVETGISLGEVLTKANSRLCEGNDAGMFVTTWIGYLNLKTGELRYANAGHNLPLLKRKDGKFEYLKMPAGFVLAGMDGIKYKEQSLMMSPGDELFVYTDGVVEATNVNKELYGDARLEECLNSHPDETAKQLCESVLDDVNRFYEGEEQFDDITELSLKFLHYSQTQKQ
jgi:sigma-B regulation protein RsbU (phosphoserine phosphatase)